MEFMKAIEERMSIRSFKDKDVDDKLIEKILYCGNCAPSGGNLQPWEFIIIKNQKTKRKIVDATFIGNDFDGLKHQEWMMSAPVFIVVCADVERSRARYGKKAEESLIYLDCSACIENMLLAIVDLGLASCFVSGYREKELIKALSLPVDIRPLAILPIGHADIIPQKRKKKEVSAFIHYEDFGNKGL
ncbi:albonoursin synthase [Oxobacter pfennigii]|uniref:Albonoursin synthase n=1 Tax=Oxobacter pfennigii TaxID=36849 RepID=A0A0P8W1M1_9CLOT|nr:nitroreductase family protein [Oxobacter pfennigii]KPU42333.1 albonoursin synthase [Oxobacter pfennigii]